MIQLKVRTENLLLSITKNCETPIKQTHRNAEETLKFEITKPRETFLFKLQISIEGSWMLGLTFLEVYNSILIITEENNKFELYTDLVDDHEFSYDQLKDSVEGILCLSDFSTEDIQHEIQGQNIIKSYRKLAIEGDRLMVITC